MEKKLIFLAAILVLILISGCLEPPEKCGDGKCGPKEQANPALCPQDCGEKLELKQVIGETAVTSGDGRYGRPEVIVIDNRIFFAFQDAAGFKLVELNEDLSYKSPVYDIFDGPDTKDPHDIRLATDGTNLWYAFASLIRRLASTCDGHFLNIAKYDISGGEPKLENSELDIAKGCPFKDPSPDLSIPENPELVDDPTPIFYNGEYVVLTRAWWNHTVHHIRTFDQNFNLLRDLTLDLGPLTNYKTLSQNALVSINGKIYIIGGLAIKPTDASIYAIPLSSNLTSVDGEIISLVDDPNKASNSKQVTAARYVDGKLYINYLKGKGVPGESLQHLGVFDVKNNFASITQIQFQDVPFEYNHASIEVLGNKVYVFYNEGEITGNVLGQVFEWK